nr:inner membrane protein [Raoultella sp. NCTC 9187]
MLFLQRHYEERWRDVGDFLEELTTTWYFGAAVIVLWLLSRVLHIICCWRSPGWLFWPVRRWVSLLAKDKNRYSKFGLHQGGSAANPRDHR